MYNFSLKAIFLFFCTLSVRTSFAYSAYVADVGAPAVFIIDTETNTVTGTVSSGLFPSFAFPFSIVTAPDGNTTYVGDFDNLAIYVIDTNPISPSFNTATAFVNIPEGTGVPFSMAITPDGTTLYVATSSSGAIFPFNTSSNTFSSPVTGIDPDSFIFSFVIYPGGTYAYATDSENGTVYVIDTDPSSGSYHTVLSSIGAPGIISVLFNPNGAVSYISVSGAVGVFDANPSSMTWNTLIGLVNVVSYEPLSLPVGLATNPEGTLLYILDPSNQCIYTSQATGTYEVIQQTAVEQNTSPPYVGLGVTPDGVSIYIAPLLPTVYVMNGTNYTLTSVTNTTSTPFVQPSSISFSVPTAPNPTPAPSNSLYDFKRLQEIYNQEVLKARSILHPK